MDRRKAITKNIEMKAFCLVFKIANIISVRTEQNVI